MNNKICYINRFLSLTKERRVKFYSHIFDRETHYNLFNLNTPSDFHLTS